MTINMDYFWKINNCYGTTSSTESDLYQLKKDINTGFDYTVDYNTVKINDVSRELLIVHVYDKPYEKNIKSRPDESFKLGDCVVWDNNSWLITKVDADQGIYTEGKIEQCNYNLKFQDADGNIITLPVVFEQSTANLKFNDMITTIKGDAEIKCRFDSLYSNLLVPSKNDTNVRLMIDNRLPNIDIPNCYKIVSSVLESYDSGSNGVLTITLNKDDYNVSLDRKDLGICNYNSKSVSTGTAQITFDNNAIITCGGSFKKFVFVCKDVNGSILNYTPTWSYTSSTGSISNFTFVPDSINNKVIKVKCADLSSMIGSTLTLSVIAQEDSNYHSSLIIKIVAL